MDACARGSDVSSPGQRPVSLCEDTIPARKAIQACFCVAKPLLSERFMMRTLIALFVCVLPTLAAAQESFTYKVAATNKTSTMQKEMQEGGAAGYRFASVMGGDTAFGGKEVVVVMQKAASATGRYQYRLLATNKTSTMQKEMQEASDAGFQYVGQTVFESFGGQEVVTIFERQIDAPFTQKFEYKLLATNRTSTLEKELKEAGSAHFEIVGMTVGETLGGGNEVVTITRRKITE